jgi:uncharacterized protein YuzE
MRADYDSEADALLIELVADPIAAGGDDEIDDRCRVSMNRHGQAVAVEVLYPSIGMEDQLQAAAARHGLDAEALLIAARAAVAAPDREIVIEVRARTVA